MQKKDFLYNNIIKILLNLLFIIGFSLILSVSFKGLVIDRIKVDGVRELFYSNSNLLVLKITTFIVLILQISYLIFLGINDLKKENKYKKIDLVVNSIMLIYSIYTITLFPLDLDKYNKFGFSFSLANIIISSILIINTLLVNKVKDEKKQLSIAVIAEGSVLAALAVVLSLISKLIPFLELPNGGSFSLSMLPLFIFGLRRGVNAGLVMGFVYGLINFITDGFLLHWGSIFFDYLIPFSLLTGVSGIFSNKALKGSYKHVVAAVLIGGFVRYIMHGFSGVLFFADYAGETNAWLYSFIIYNLPYMLISTIGSLIIILPLSKDLIFIESRIK